MSDASSNRRAEATDEETGSFASSRATPRAAPRRPASPWPGRCLALAYGTMISIILLWAALRFTGLDAMLMADGRLVLGLAWLSWAAMAVLGVGIATAILHSLSRSDVPRSLAFAWTICAVAVLAAAVWFDLFRIVAILIAAAFEGLVVTAAQAQALLVERAPLFPLSLLTGMLLPLLGIGVSVPQDGSADRQIIAALVAISILLVYAVARGHARRAIGHARATPLPPRPLFLLLIGVLAIPAYADLHNQYLVTSHMTRIQGGGIVARPAAAPAASQRQVNTILLNVRSAPDLQAMVVDQLPEGTPVSVFEQQGAWTRIGTDRWVATRYLGAATP